MSFNLNRSTFDVTSSLPLGCSDWNAHFILFFSEHHKADGFKHQVSPRLCTNTHTHRPSHTQGVLERRSQTIQACLQHRDANKTDLIYAQLIIMFPRNAEKLTQSRKKEKCSGCEGALGGDLRDRGMASGREERRWRRQRARYQGSGFVTDLVALKGLEKKSYI